jgi:hypothetical protein
LKLGEEEDASKKGKAGIELFKVFMLARLRKSDNIGICSW